MLLIFSKNSNSEGILQPDQNNPELLRLLICGDKGGPSTNILCEFLNCKASHSFKSAKLLGAKDNQENIKTIFGPIIAKIENFDVNQLGNVIIQ